jgi:hypothetical protein
VQHLSTLRVLNYAMAAIYALATLLSVAITIAIAIWGWPAIHEAMALEQDPAAPPPAVVAGAVLAIFGVVVLILLVECVLLVLAGRAVGQGRGRILQTVLAVLTIASFPVGTAYAIYALWVCWSNPPTRAAFEQSR